MYNIYMHVCMCTFHVFTFLKDTIKLTSSPRVNNFLTATSLFADFQIALYTVPKLPEPNLSWNSKSSDWNSAHFISKCHLFLFLFDYEDLSLYLYLISSIMPKSSKTTKKYMTTY